MRIKRKTIAIVVFIAMAFGVLAYLGIVDPNRVRIEAQNLVQDAARTAGDAVNLSAPAPAGDPKAAAQCRANLEAIQRAKAALRKRTGYATGSASWGDIVKELGYEPSCPAGGRYTPGTFEQNARCSIGGGGSPGEADDHILKSY